MEIKRKLEMSVATDRRYIIRQSEKAEQISCAVCDGAMLTAEQTAGFFGIGQRLIFRAIEKEAVHFAEIDMCEVAVCLQSMAKMMDDDKIPKLNAVPETNLVRKKNEKQN